MQIMKKPHGIPLPVLCMMWHLSSHLTTLDTGCPFIPGTNQKKMKDEMQQSQCSGDNGNQKYQLELKLKQLHVTLTIFVCFIHACFFCFGELGMKPIWICLLYTYLHLTSRCNHAYHIFCFSFKSMPSPALSISGRSFIFSSGLLAHCFNLFIIVNFNCLTIWYLARGSPKRLQVWHNG